MPFSNQLKLEVRRKAAFRCCRCHEIGIDIHHVIPQSQRGSDDFSNAAPLCQNCHDRLGDNPQKRKEIIQMRDWWYGIVAERFGASEQFKKGFDQLGMDLRELITGHLDTSEIFQQELKRESPNILRSGKEL